VLENFQNEEESLSLSCWYGIELVLRLNTVGFVVIAYSSRLIQDGAERAYATVVQE